MRNHHSVSRETCERIQEIARRLGYQPDPYLSGLATYRRRVQSGQYKATLAWLSNYPEGESWSATPVFQRYYEGAQARAAALGYQLEEHRLRQPGMTQKRMVQILRARGIAGLLLAPQPMAEMSLEGFPFEQFSAVTFGFTLVEPQLHLVTLHQFRSTEKLFRKLLSLGYRRPGLALSIESDLRASHGWSAAFWSEQRSLPEAQRVPHLLEQPLQHDHVLAWYQEHRPDVIVGILPDIYTWLTEAGVKIPGEVGFAMLSVPDEGVFFSGVDENPREIGGRALEFLVDMLTRGERGVPSVPINILVEGSWAVGKTLQKKPD